MPDRAESCGGCRWFEYTVRNVHGRCRRYPPRMDGLEFPSVGAVEWCGEFAPTGNTVIDSRDEYEKGPKR